jgi:hypothetical protein
VHKRPSANLPKRGSRIIKPKNQKIITKQKIAKKRTGGLVAVTERNLAEKAGHLEMLAGGKKDKKKDGKKDGNKK